MKKLIRKVKTEKGFTLVELLIVMIISLIMLAGMVGLVIMGFNSFTNGRNLASVTDSSRRALPAIDREIKSLLHINDADCATPVYKVTAPPEGVYQGTSFYSNIANNNLGATSVAGSYVNAEKVEFYLDTNGNLIQKTTPPSGSSTTATLCSYVDSFRVYYFAPGVVPETGSPPSNRLTGANLNVGAGSVKIVITIKKGTITRTFEQTSFLRVLQRS
jgi:prepilin-type N-terminal cleavage/methylation domain-containing protein